MSEFDSTGPSPEDQPGLTDTYFRNTRRIVQENGDCEVEYAVFMRRPVTYAGRLAIGWLRAMAAHRGVEVEVEEPHIDGAWVGSGEVLCYIRGPFATLVDLETIFLQRLGASCVAAYNAYNMCVELPDVAFLAMDARHCAGSDMAELMAYGASVGSKKAKAKTGAIGFTGSSTDATAHFFGQERGAGTMPHALVGYAGSTLRAAQMFHESVPDAPLTVLVDYFGKEITDSSRWRTISRNWRLPVALPSGWTPMAVVSARAGHAAILCRAGPSCSLCHPRLPDGLRTEAPDGNRCQRGGGLASSRDARRQRVRQGAYRRLQRVRP